MVLIFRFPKTFQTPNSDRTKCGTVMKSYLTLTANGIKLSAPTSVVVLIDCVRLKQESILPSSASFFSSPTQTAISSFHLLLFINQPISLNTYCLLSTGTVLLIPPQWVTRTYMDVWKQPTNSISWAEPQPELPSNILWWKWIKFWCWCRVPNGIDILPKQIINEGDKITTSPTTMGWTPCLKPFTKKSTITQNLHHHTRIQYFQKCVIISSLIQAGKLYIFFQKNPPAIGSSKTNIRCMCFGVD